MAYYYWLASLTCYPVPTLREFSTLSGVRWVQEEFIERINSQDLNERRSKIELRFSFLRRCIEELKPWFAKAPSSTSWHLWKINLKLYLVHSKKSWLPLEPFQLIQIKNNQISWSVRLSWVNKYFNETVHFWVIFSSNMCLSKWAPTSEQIHL